MLETPVADKEKDHSRFAAENGRAGGAVDGGG
jgi:hypothetical protein